MNPLQNRTSSWYNKLDALFQLVGWNQKAGAKIGIAFLAFRRGFRIFCHGTAAA
jgi:hypothetical protein